jgi:hypothetical protein
MDLPTFIVIMFLVNGQVNVVTEPAPSLDICIKALPNVPEIVRKNVREPVQFFSASCMTIRPFPQRDA